MAKELNIDFTDTVTFNGAEYFPEIIAENSQMVLIRLEVFNEEMIKRKEMEANETELRYLEDKQRNEDEILKLKQKVDKIKSIVDKKEAEKLNSISVLHP